MLRSGVCWITTIVLLFGIGYLVQGAEQLASTPILASSSPYRAVLNEYCVRCHNQKLKTAGLTLDNADLANVADEAATWERVVRKLRSGSMPPAGMPRPDAATYNSLITYLEMELDRAAG